MSYWYLMIPGVIIATLVIFKLYCKFTCGVYKGKERLEGKTAIVTGANSGCGMETAKDFARRGARVIMACRNMKTAETVRNMIISETGNNNIIIKNVDFNSLANVRRCANEILAEEPRIDILVNNAGAVGIGFKQTEDGIDELMQANYFGPFLFTNMLLGKIKESAPSRIVHVSSYGYLAGKIDFEHLLVAKPKFYALLCADSKLANIYFSNELARRLEGTGVTSNSLHPGVFASEANREFSRLYQRCFKLFVSNFCKSVEEGAQTSIYLSVSPDVAKISGKYFEDCKQVRLRNNADNVEIAKKLWEASEDAVQLRPEEKHY